jgi:hypothetical protein
LAGALHALSPEICLGEILRRLRPEDLANLNEYRLTELEIRLDAALDCRDPEAIGLSLSDLVDDRDFSVPQQVAAAAITRGAEGILVALGHGPRRQSRNLPQPALAKVGSLCNRQPGPATLRTTIRRLRMAFSQDMLETMAAWCRDSLELAEQRREARAQFFGDEEPLPVKYWGGAEELTSRERRFLGYFLLNWRLLSGEIPAGVAAKRLFQGDTQAEVLTAVAGTRFVFAVVKSVRGRDVSLEVEPEHFEVRHSQWASLVHRDTAVAAHLVPVRHGRWLLGPGWVNLPFTMGPGLRANLGSLMPVDAIGLERMLQGRSRSPDEPARPEPPRDESLEDAVARMTAWAEGHSQPGLVRPISEWTALVVKHLDNPATTQFFSEVVSRVGEFASDQELQELAGLAMNIWNNTPQPDRGGRTANQMIGVSPEP